MYVFRVSTLTGEAGKLARDMCLGFASQANCEVKLTVKSCEVLYCRSIWFRRLFSPAGRGRHLTKFSEFFEQSAEIEGRFCLILPDHTASTEGWYS